MPASRWDILKGVLGRVSAAVAHRGRPLLLAPNFSKAHLHGGRAPCLTAGHSCTTAEQPKTRGLPCPPRADFQMVGEQVLGAMQHCCYWLADHEGATSATCRQAAHRLHTNDCCLEEMVWPLAAKWGFAAPPVSELLLLRCFRGWAGQRRSCLCRWDPAWPSRSHIASVICPDTGPARVVERLKDAEDHRYPSREDPA